MDYAKTVKHVGDVNLPEGRKRYTSSREEDNDDVQICLSLWQRKRDCYSHRGRMWNVQEKKSMSAVETRQIDE